MFIAAASHRPPHGKNLNQDLSLCCYHSLNRHLTQNKYYIHFLRLFPQWGPQSSVNPWLLWWPVVWAFGTVGGLGEAVHPLQTAWFPGSMWEEIQPNSVAVLTTRQGPWTPVPWHTHPVPGSPALTAITSLCNTCYVRFDQVFTSLSLPCAVNEALRTGPRSSTSVSPACSPEPHAQQALDRCFAKLGGGNPTHATINSIHSVSKNSILGNFVSFLKAGKESFSFLRRWKIPRS